MPNPDLIRIVFLSIESSLIALAMVHARTGRFDRVTRYTAWVAVGGSMLLSIGAMYSAVSEITRSDYPWTLPGRPLGTYADPTVVGVLMVILTALLLFIAAVLAFSRPKPAGSLFAIGALAIFLGVVRMRLFDDTFPAEYLSDALVFGALPAFVVATLLWSAR